VVAAGGGDAGVAAELEDGNIKVAQGGHDLGTVARADLGGVFAVGHVADMVQSCDAPVAAIPLGHLDRGGLVGGQSDDGVAGLGGPSPGGPKAPLNAAIEDVLDRGEVA
jgi:hypothetical protein